MKKLEEYVGSMPDFPGPEIIFRGATGILQDADGLHMTANSLIDMIENLDHDLVIDSESRGFIFEVPVAYTQHKGFVPVRKKGELPRETISIECGLEYGQATIEMHEDAIRLGQKVVIVDGLIAAGGTTEAIVKLIEQLGGQVVKVCFVMELTELKGREHLERYDADSAIIYEDKQENEIDLVTERAHQIEK